MTKKLGFGLMRLPMNGGKVDIPQVCQMADRFIEEGFTYFDTAHGYIGGQSETAFRECVAKRYPRDAYTITDKLTENYFNSQEDIRPFFASQLEACGVDYFDYYLMHAQNKENFKKFKACRAYETALELREEGKLRHFGISFHDTAEVLDMILTEYPQIEVVQIQLNYVDFNDAAVQSRLCLEVCEKHKKPVIVMEPVKGGSLVNLPALAQAQFDALNKSRSRELSNASYAIRFAASFDRIFMVLSGMSSTAQLEDNISYMADFVPLDDEERETVERVCGIFRDQGLIPCTACRYCTDGCPMSISIPDLFACMNAKKHFNDWNQDFYYNDVHTVGGGKASDCIKCGACEAACPQHLPIRELLEQVAATFEK